MIPLLSLLPKNQSNDTLDNFLSKKNLLNPFTDDSISQVKKILKLELALIIIGAVAYIGEDILFTFWGATTLKTSETLTSLSGDLFLMLLFTVLYYILKVGQNKIAEKN